MYALVFLIAGALAGAAGIMLGLKYNVYPTMGNIGLKAFIASVFGGLGSVRGTILGAIIIGLIEVFVSGYIDSGLRDLITFALLIAVLLVKPSGLMGVDIEEKA
jgi:branched-chain amino acid transport system permease protein